MWKLIRIFILLSVLAFVALGTLVDRWRTTDWDHTLWIGIFPVNADGREGTGRYIASLSRERFSAIESFFAREAGRWGVTIEQPVRIELYPQVQEPPPALEGDAGVLGSIWWSLRTRFYTWRVAGDELADIRMFVLFNDPEVTHAVPHSLGLQKGLLGIVHAYAGREYDATNNFVVAHEVMHTLGATDKYDPASNLPLYPDGYAEPQVEPRYPQQTAEIMGGRIPLSPRVAEMPQGLGEVVVGPQTAAEINWTNR
jgi:hypothetical protein